MKAYIFLNGFYDYRYVSFYKKQIESADDGTVSICADGGIKIFEEINDQFNVQLYPDVLLGDGDSVEIDNFANLDIEVVPKIGQSRTDGEFAVSYAIEKYNCNSITIFGGLNDTRDYNTDHFLGNLKLMRFGFCIYQKNSSDKSQYQVVMQDVFQDIHFVVDSIAIKRKRITNQQSSIVNPRIERVSLWTDYSNTVVASSKNLRWSMKNFYIDPNALNAMRNEFAPDAQTASITLQDDSDPVYLIHTLGKHRFVGKRRYDNRTQVSRRNLGSEL